MIVCSWTLVLCVYTWCDGRTIIVCRVLFTHPRGVTKNKFTSFFAHIIISPEVCWKLLSSNIRTTRRDFKKNKTSYSTSSVLSIIFSQCRSFHLWREIVAPELAGISKFMHVHIHSTCVVYKKNSCCQQGTKWIHFSRDIEIQSKSISVWTFPRVHHGVSIPWKFRGGSNIRCFV